MKKELYLKRLVHTEQIETLLHEFAPSLGPEISLAVSDADGHLLGSHRPFPADVVSSLLEAARGVVDLDGPDRDDIVSTPLGLVTPICVEEQQVGLVMVTSSLPLPDQTQVALAALRCSLESLAMMALEKRAVVQETLDRYREINLLYKLGETLITCLDVNELPQRALAESNRIIQARWGAVLLYDEEKKLTITTSVGPTGELAKVVAQARTLLEEVARTGKPKIINDFSDGERRVPLLIVPLRTSERRLGVILLVDKVGEEGFTAGDEKLLSALSWQAAISLENARLFHNVRRQRDEIATMKNYMDNIFASIVSGVITIDTQDIVTTFNQAAETILRVSAQQAVGRSYQQELGFLCDTPLPALIENVCQRGGAGMTREIGLRLPQGEQLYLNLSLSPLRGGGEENLGVAIVMEDVTEKRRHERESALVRRYLPSELVDRLPHDLAELGLHGERREITVFFTDVRGFTKLSEFKPPEWVVERLNAYLAMAVTEVRARRGIVDKYMGDGVMALFNTPLLEEEEHAWQAVQTAWAVKEAMEAYHRHAALEDQFSVGIGVCTGDAVVGNVGAKDRMEYTAIGNPVNIAFFLQGHAQPGQILLGHTTWEVVQNRVHVNPLEAIRVKGQQSPTRIYELVGLITPDE